MPLPRKPVPFPYWAFLLLGSAALILPRPAAADAIDGNWCSKAGERVQINGSLVVTPGGSQISGDYGRHDFSFVVPPKEKDAGVKFDMTMADEETVLVTRKVAGTAQGLPETWRRCGATS